MGIRRGDRSGAAQLPELESGRRLVARELRWRKKLRNGGRPLTFAEVGRQIGDPGATQLQQFLYGRRALPFALALRIALKYRMRVEPLLTRDQRKMLRLVRVYERMRAEAWSPPA